MPITMNAANENSQQQTTFARLPVWLLFAGTVIIVGSAILFARLVWEETVWTWLRGPQMIGFSLAHGSGAILFIFPPLLFIWTIIAVALALRNKLKKRRNATTTWVALGLAISLLAVGSLPEGFWERVFISKMAASSQAGDLLLYAAYRGDVGVVRGFLSHGVPVNVIDHADWRTALHGAAIKGDTQLLRYLISKGADINALDRSGDSPLELAASRGNQEAADFLTEQGAKRIRGDEAQRQKAMHDEVREDIDKLNRAEGLQH